MKNSNKLKRFNLQTAIKFLPNSLTLIRLLIVFPIIYFLETNKFAFILPLLILGGLTDYFDGYFAKRYNLMTSFGAVIDPVADKIFTIIPLIGLYQLLFSGNSLYQRLDPPGKMDYPPPGKLNLKLFLFLFH